MVFKRGQFSHAPRVFHAAREEAAAGNFRARAHTGRGTPFSVRTAYHREARIASVIFHFSVPIPHLTERRFAGIIIFRFLRLRANGTGFAIFAIFWEGGWNGRADL